jgi:anti-sigma regulatory factor (Ser/Thr protein kinase)
MITDEGSGFDYNSTMRMVDYSVEKNSLPHGRGINMTKVLFDKVEYNSKGNQVLLIKKF